MGNSWSFGPRRRRVRRSRVLGAVVGFVLAGGVAFAAWSVIVDNAPGYTNAGSLIAPTVASGDSFTGNKCYPGGTCDGLFNIVNPNGALVVSGTGTPTSLGSPTGCDVYLTANTQTALAVPVPAGTTNNVVVPNAFKLSPTTPTSCQGSFLHGNVKLTFATP